MKKFQVLIVDDEIYSIKGVQAGVDWENLSISIVLTAQSMKQAQEVFLNNRVDVLICDIEMPKGSGLELVSWVKEKYPSTEVVFLTCHSDFQYAKQALQLKSFNYLLKPVDYQELQGVIQNALEKITKDREDKETYLRLEKSHYMVMQERFWKELINQVIPSNLEELEINMKNYKISFPEFTTFLPILIHVQSWKKSLSPKDENILNNALQFALWEELIRNVSGAHLINLGTGYVLLIIPSVKVIDTVETRNRCNHFISQFSQYFSCELCCYIGKQVAIHKVVNIFQELRELDRNNVTVSNQSIELRNKKIESMSIPEIPGADWANYMRNGFKEKLLSEIIKYFETWRGKGTNITAHSLQLFYQDFLQLIFYVLQVKGIHANQVFSQNLLTEKPERVLKSLTSLQEWVVYVADVAINQLHPLQEKESIVEIVKQYINENIGEQRLSRVSIANRVYLNPDYLTRLFKKETGLSLTDYLQQHRIEYAKRLLLETNLTISEIALASGYSNFSYFSTVFKKVTKSNPVEYRKMANIKEMSEKRK
ncbi:helix-turn-helix domain-containing protein [Bacillus salipaludis]|uniref:Helix-turn-helix domain-containing protein n=1 Tax=Bacillus salipaludis TaxID=2547811 RepID=A0ABW8RLL7_9BACI